MASVAPPPLSNVYNPADYQNTALSTALATKQNVIGPNNRLDASYIGSGGVATAEFDFVGGTTSSIQGQLDGLSGGGVAVHHSHAFPTVSDNTVTPWPDMVAYYSFDDSANLGRDSSGNGFHGINRGAEYVPDTTRNHSAQFTRIATASDTVDVSNIRVVDISDHASSFALDEFTISLWYRCTSATGYHAVFSLVDNSQIQSHFSVLHSVGSTRVLCLVNSVNVFDIKVNTTENAWHHVAVTMGPGGNTVIVDNVALTAYTVGTSSTYLNFSGVGSNLAFVPNRITLAATAGPAAAYPLEERYKFALDGQISDIAVFGRALTSAECTALWNDDYGYVCFLFAGQSNMVGLGTTSIADDYDYSLYNGRVYKYDTYNNILHTPGTISASNPYTPIAPYTTTANTIYQVTSTGAVANLSHPMDLGTGYGLGVVDRVGLWKTFADDLLQYATIPYRKKVLFLPCAIGGTAFANHWSPGMICYEVAKNVCNAVLDPSISALNGLNVLGGMLWNQGENSCAELDTNFKNNFLGMKQGFETDIHGFTPSTPIVVAQVAGNFYDTFIAPTPSPGVSMKQLVNMSYAELAETYANIALVYTLGDSPFQTDLKHMLSSAYRTLGHRYYDAYCLASTMANRKNVDGKAIVVNSRYGVRDMVVTIPTTFSSGIAVVGDVGADNITTMADDIATIAADLLSTQNRVSVLEPAACDIISSAVTMSKVYTLAYLPPTLISALSGSSVLTISLPSVSGINDGRTWSVYLRTVGVGSSVVINVTGGLAIDVSLGTSTVTTTTSYTLQSGPSAFSRRLFQVMNGQWFLVG